MTRKCKWWTLAALLTGGVVVLGGCVGAFWQGLASTGWPGHPWWLNVAVDVLKEATLYRT